ncbi:hypothetical protein SAMN05421763_105331 [[Luteovulum] sphaeroides subsp. megalophilum]|uniref:hypothetical protein n=1 Tax=Cereibacter sphaeroides TaxID=1063 RepID=UPI000B655ADC|nr:hypothetical protein [Cereibacter sphaeroides]SNT17125.1 hypothetical protein SAMN05421763_105331 [[Luteovulum] sphaeroides subsp. megalophilum]
MAKELEPTSGVAGRAILARWAIVLLILLPLMLGVVTGIVDLPPAPPDVVNGCAR